ncbi:MAG: ABC transporter ATP-binding protein [Thermochromatium sp.]
MTLLALEAVTVQLGGRTLVHELSFQIGAGELVGLIGPNGAGKSTILKAIAQLLPYRGQIQLQGKPLDRIPARERARQLAYLGQDDHLQWPISVADLVALGRHPYHGGWWPGVGRLTDEDRQGIEAALHATHVWSLRARASDTLSGGERARVRLARALAVGAPLLLADEPVAALDPHHQLKVMELLRAQVQQGKSVILVLHDLTLASRFCDRLLLLHEGRTLAAGTVETVLSPQHLRLAYGIEVVMGQYQGQRYLVPWSSLEA